MIRCAIVGNAKSIFGKKQGREIDLHDVVIRINRPQITEKKDQGSKTTVMCVFDGTLKHVNQKSKQYQVINTTVDMGAEVEFWSKVISQETGIYNARPTTGFMAIQYALSKGYEIDLYGFDWYESPTYYLDHLKSGPWNRHSPSWEKEKILEWIDPNNIH